MEISMQMARFRPHLSQAIISSSLYARYVHLVAAITGVSLSRAFLIVGFFFRGQVPLKPKSLGGAAQSETGLDFDVCQELRDFAGKAFDPA
ncbi:hypothetical protein SAMN05444004_103233 [Jannaschia faecimaris]|uniref:Uncharacterized protein n=1 Tax=Jannaschia faecimaris TaxID=1244108 RepID=A0A1H3N1V1_9RHOB|nr:hypothetical protein SAMN05444004_103233 [Jannaschia faecimaris]